MRPATRGSVWIGVLLAAAIALPVPFVPQGKDTCGAAALAMVLQYHGHGVAHDAIAEALVESELRGIRGSKLTDFAREQGMVAVAFAGDLPLLREHLAKGRPLVVAISAGRDRYHDVVVVGLDDERGELIVHDPDLGAGRRLAVQDFDRRWEASGRWTLLVQPAGDAAEAAGRVETAAEWEQAPTTPAASTLDAEIEDGSYEGLVARAVALGRADDRAGAAALLNRAVALVPDRAEAWAERGGLRFLEGRYEEAIADLGRSTAIHDEAYARGLLASSLQLAGREMEALATWNRLGEPALGRVEIGGLQRTRDAVARREVGLDAGALLTPAAIRRAHRCLAETGVFERITIRAKPHGDGTADLEVALSERHGFAHGPLDFLVGTGVGLAWQRLHLRYANLGGSGIGLGGWYRWQENREETALVLTWPRPFALPFYARLDGVRGEQAYDVGTPFMVRRHGATFGLRHVLASAPVLSFGARFEDRTVSVVRDDAKAGRVVGAEAGIEGRVIETRRQRLSGSVKLFAASRLLASTLEYGQAEAELRYDAILSTPEGRSVERSVVVARLRGGLGTEGMPVDAMYAPGVSPESDLPLRAHPLTRRGVIGSNPIGRAVALLNVEWRQRVLHRSAFDVGLVAFSDGAGISRPAEGGGGGVLVDVGVGLRVTLVAGATLRVDQAWGLRDGRHALFVGLNQAF